MAETTGALRKLAENIYLFWGLLALPAVYLVLGKLIWRDQFNFLGLSGEYSGWLLIISMMVTPLMLILRRPLPWLKARRRHIGVASFLYGLLHLAYWLLDASVWSFIKSFFRLAVLPGWIALAILLVLALTSTDKAVASMGVRWKALQRWVYPAAVLTLLHWVMTYETGINPAVYFLPLGLLSAWRYWRYRARMA